MTVTEQKPFWDTYQDNAWMTCLPSSQNFDYLSLGLGSEIGEVQGVLKRFIRGDYIGQHDSFIKDLTKEIGDCCWYLFSLLTFKKTSLYSYSVSSQFTGTDIFAATRRLSSVADDFITRVDMSYHGDPVYSNLLMHLSYIGAYFGISIYDAAIGNIEKLSLRYAKNLIMGSGDHR